MRTSTSPWTSRAISRTIYIEDPGTHPTTGNAYNSIRPHVDNYSVVTELIHYLGPATVTQYGDSVLTQNGPNKAGQPPPRAPQRHNHRPKTYCAAHLPEG
jgi:hypothetical protein